MMKYAAEKRVFITGLGQCSSLGVGVREFWTALVAARSGLSRLDLLGVARKGMGGLLSIPESPHTGGKFTSAIRFAIKEAIEDAGLAITGRQQGIVVIAGSNFGDCHTFLKHGDFFYSLRNAIAEFDLSSEFWGVSTACASGIGVLGLARDLIGYEGVEKAIVCTYDFITPYNYSGLDSLRALSQDTIRPFDRTRSGTVIGEGVAAPVLESEFSAKERGAPIYGEITGYGISNDAYHFTAPEPSGIGMRTAMSQALREAGIAPSGIGHLSAHGTGTLYNDSIETRSVHKVFGENARGVPITSIKTAIGHTMGAAGAFACIAALLSLRDGIVPPILNYQERDSECDLDYVFNKSRYVSVDTAMCNAYGLWGCNASLIITRTDKKERHSRERLGISNSPVRMTVAGLGPVSSIGTGIDAFSYGLRHAQNPNREFRDVDGFDINDYVTLKTQCLDRASGMALAGSALAIKDAGWDRDPGDPTKTGLVLGTAYGNMATLQTYLESGNISPLRFVHTFVNAPAGLTSQVLGLRGVHSVLCSGPLAGLQAIRYASYLLLTEKVDRVICGGVDSLAFYRNSTISGYPEFSHPLGEGAGMLALQRGNETGEGYTIELAGIGINSSNTIEPYLFRSALHRALESANISGIELDATVLATDRIDRYGDMERSVLMDCGVPEERWVELSTVTGLCGAANGGLSAVLACLFLRDRSNYTAVAVNGFYKNQFIVMVFRRINHG